MLYTIPVSHSVNGMYYGKSLEISPDITSPAVLLDVHIQKKQSQDGKNASALVFPSEQHSQDNEITKG